jgi:hypothetical protein
VEEFLGRWESIAPLKKFAIVAVSVTKATLSRIVDHWIVSAARIDPLTILPTLFASANGKQYCQYYRRRYEVIGLPLFEIYRLVRDDGFDSWKRLRVSME